MIKYNWVIIMKKFLTGALLLTLFLIIYVYRAPLYNLYFDYLVPNSKKITKLETNKYYRDYNFKYVQNTTNFEPNNKQDILNIYYTVINSGMEKFTFVCPKNYKSCSEDVNNVAHNQEILSNINNYVHPYNSFKSLETEVSTNDVITIKLKHVYTEKMITLIDYEIDNLINKNIKKKMTNVEKIKTIHNVIINNTKYDKERTDNKITKYSSDNAYGVLIEKYGVCGGYTDAYMLFLEKLNIKNYKISSENHIWNYVNVNENWYHVDLTWDDPIDEDNPDNDLLDDTYLLLTTSQLKNMKNDTIHQFDENTFGE